MLNSASDPSCAPLMALRDFAHWEPTGIFVPKSFILLKGPRLVRAGVQVADRLSPLNGPWRQVLELRLISISGSKRARLMSRALVVTLLQRREPLNVDDQWCRISGNYLTIGIDET